MTEGQTINVGGVHPSVAQDMINPQNLLFIIEHDLKGEVLGENNTWVKVVGGQVLTEPDIKEIMSIVRAHLSTVSLTSKIPEHKICEICFGRSGINRGLIRYFMLKRHDYDKKYLSALFLKIPYMVYYGLLSAEGGGLRDTIAKTVSENIQRLSGGKGPLDSLNIFNRGGGGG